MSKHLPNCPHLSKYDGLGDAGIIMAINEKHKKNNSYDYQDFTEVNNTLDNVSKTLEEAKDFIGGLDTEIEEMCKECYIAGYKQARKDIKHKKYRNPYYAWIEYWGS